MDTGPRVKRPQPHQDEAVFPLMVHDEMATVLLWYWTKTPPPYPRAVFPLMMHDEMATVTPWT